MQKDRKTCQYTMRNIHKLLFGMPFGVKSTEISELGGDVCGFYHGIKQSKSSVLAYKGRHIERGLHAKLCILALNIERFGCPKVGELMNEMVWLEACENHIVLDAYTHCAEVEAYAYWLEKNNERLMNNIIVMNNIFIQ